MTKNEALKEALYLIEAFGRGCDCYYYSMDISRVIDALKEALAQPTIRNNQTVQKPLSDEEILSIDGLECVDEEYIKRFARAIEKRILAR